MWSDYFYLKYFLFSKQALNLIKYLSYCIFFNVQKTILCHIRNLEYAYKIKFTTISFVCAMLWAESILLKCKKKKDQVLLMCFFDRNKFKLYASWFDVT
jgi:hypothetical protein